jgi:hypothetical protein
MSIQSELLAIKGKHELLTAEEVVEWAKNHQTSALHATFEWDNRKAAEEYRIWQARRLIAIHITVEEGARRFVSLSIDRSRDGGGYRDINDVLANKSLHEVLLEDALKELDRMQLKFDRLKELKPIWRERDKIRTKKKGDERERRTAG